jgi:16S rRNA (guanine(1405)-N(7))-methyltransferase
MSLNTQESLIVDAVLRSRKYRSLYRPTVEHIVETLSSRYPPKQLEHEVKRKLHQIWGAYFTRPNFEKLLAKVEAEKIAGLEPQTIIKPLLLLQTSTSERIPVLPDFYTRIFEVTGMPKKVVEYGCGVNALSYLWMPKGIQYVGMDVDTDLMNFLNGVFRLLRLEQNASVQLGDILEDAFLPGDVSLLLKVLVIFERQREGSSSAILEALPSRYVVVSFPTRSLSGKERGMKKHYTELFTGLVSGRGWRMETVEFESELVFVVDKGNVKPSS